MAAGAPAAGRRRPRCRAAAAPHRAQLRQLRRPGRRQRRVRHRAVGARRAVRAAARRRRRRQPARPRRQRQRARSPSAPAGLQARPLLYGLILFARTLGPDAQLVTVRSRLSRARPTSAAWAVRVGRDTLHVLLIDKSRRAERVSLRLPATGARPTCSACSPRRRRRDPASPSAAARSAPTGAGRVCPTRQTVIAARRRLRGERAQHERRADHRPGARPVPSARDAAATDARRRRGARSAPPAARSPRR